MVLPEPVDIDAEAAADYWRLLHAGHEPPTLAERLEERRPRWMRYGACRGHGTVVFFPSRTATATARAICTTCFVRPNCLEYALADRDLVGIWGGTTEAERQVMRRAG